MNTPDKNQQPSTIRTDRVLLQIPDFDYFGNLLHERLYALFKYYEEWASPFMLITNLYDRDPKRIQEREEKNPADVEALIYAGTERQRQLLMSFEPKYHKDYSIWTPEGKTAFQKSLDPHWAYLKDRLFNRSMKQAETLAAFDQFRDGALKTEDIKIGKLSEYFKTFDNELRVHEHPILSAYFDIQKDLYIGIPLLGMGLFQGVVWIIFKEQEAYRFNDVLNLRRVIKYFQTEYDNLTLDWDVAGTNITKESTINKVFERLSETNPVQRDVGLLGYYKQSEYYHKERIKQSDDVVKSLKTQFAKTATITTLLDSYAHNISAHSLTALNWWFRERAEYLDENHGGRMIIETLGRDNNPLIRHYKAVQEQARGAYKKVITEILQHSKAETSRALSSYIYRALAGFVNRGLNKHTIVHAQNLSAHTRLDFSVKEILTKAFRDIENRLANITLKQPSRALSRELAPLFRFLLEKGAFWSGITRQTNISGKVSSLYNILWYDFIKNPLYLGTIANTEQVMQLHVHITFYEEEEEEVIAEIPFYNRKRIRKDAEGRLLSGRLATIDMLDFDFEKIGDKESVFVRQGEAYPRLEGPLRQTKAFFPGGVVGKHAFFTLIENEIRNVKHFRGEALEEIRRDGLVLHLSIHPRPVDSEKPTPGKKPELLKIGVWLGHVVNNIDSDLLLERIINLDKDIITEVTFQPRLGGNQQDKLCAAMLLTKTFDKVQEKDTPLGLIYYPWLKAVSADHHDHPAYVEEFEVSRRKYEEEGEETVVAAFNQKAAGKGYLKKYFHLWQGDDIVSLTEAIVPQEASLEEYARYRFMYLGNNAKTIKPHYQRQGVTRILEGDGMPDDLQAAYQCWLGVWLSGQNTVATLVEGNTEVARLVYLNGEARFESYDDIRGINEEYAEQLNKIKNAISLSLVHGSDTKITADPHRLNIRSHGELVRQFGQGKFPGKIKNMSPEMACELLEVLATRICLFDRRVYNRLIDAHSAQLDLQKNRLAYFCESLRLNIQDEEHAAWKMHKAQGFTQYHYLLLHLSFIESISKPHKPDERYKEADIIEFIDNEILQGKHPDEVGDTFRIVITTGRGRMEWWETLQQQPEYARIVAFRSIETILNGIENALQIADDVDLKYHLTKLLLGS